MGLISVNNITIPTNVTHFQPAVRLLREFLKMKFCVELWYSIVN